MKSFIWWRFYLLNDILRFFRDPWPTLWLSEERKTVVMLEEKRKWSVRDVTIIFNVVLHTRKEAAANLDIKLRRPRKTGSRAAVAVWKLPQTNFLPIIPKPWWQETQFSDGIEYEISQGEIRDDLRWHNLNSILCVS